jgi:hypothetical protein
MALFTTEPPAPLGRAGGSFMRSWVRFLGEREALGSDAMLSAQSRRGAVVAKAYWWLWAWGMELAGLGLEIDPATRELTHDGRNGGLRLRQFW